MLPFDDMPDFGSDPEPPPLPPCTVILSCNGQRVAETMVRFQGIAEDIQGRDVLTFTCPRCGEVHTSFRFG